MEKEYEILKDLISKLSDSQLEKLLLHYHALFKDFLESCQSNCQNFIDYMDENKFYQTHNNVKKEQVLVHPFVDMLTENLLSTDVEMNALMIINDEKNSRKKNNIRKRIKSIGAEEKIEKLLNNIYHLNYENLFDKIRTEKRPNITDFAQLQQENNKINQIATQSLNFENIYDLFSWWNNFRSNYNEFVCNCSHYVINTKNLGEDKTNQDKNENTTIPMDASKINIEDSIIPIDIGIEEPKHGTKIDDSLQPTVKMPKQQVQEESQETQKPEFTKSINSLLDLKDNEASVVAGKIVAFVNAEYAKLGLTEEEIDPFIEKLIITRYFEYPVIDIAETVKSERILSDRQLSVRSK